MTPLSLIREAPVRSEWSLVWKVAAGAALSAFAAVVLLAWHTSRQPKRYEVATIYLPVPPVIEANAEWVPAAEAVARRYAEEAFPAWAAANPDRECPRMVEELAPFAVGAPVFDPWGGAYMIRCAGSSVIVQSRGPDGRWATADDLRSDR